LLLGLLCTAVYAGRNIDVVKQRVVSEILTYRPDDDEICDLVRSLEADGNWPGINYEDVSNTGFEHTVHLRNMVKMSIAFSKVTCPYYLDQSVKEAISRSLEYWCDHDFICENWWHNQIGTPSNLVTILLVMDHHLDHALVQRTLEIVGRANLDASGARPGGDRIKIGGIEAKAVLVAGDEARFEQVMKVINDEIRFNTGQRGMQHDFSFHHRVDRVNNTCSYGLGYADTFAEWAVYVAGTRYAFEKEKIRLLVDYYLDGICKQMVYGIYTDKGVKNRSISRRERFRPHSTEIPERLLIVTDYRKEEIEEIIGLRNGTREPSASFCRFFWQSEHFVCQRPQYYTSVRMYSLRNRNMEEPYNSEGLRNHHKGDGANFISRTGDEYLNIWPVYDWQKIPGTTVLQKPEIPPPSEIQKEGLKAFVGAVTDGIYGAAGFDFISPHDFIKTRKSWFFFDKEYVCLGAGIESSSPHPVATTLNQSLLEGEVTVNGPDGVIELGRGAHSLQGIQWIHHGGVGYLFPEPADLHLSNRAEKGSWYDISKQWNTSREEVEKEVFKVWIDHGARPQGRRGGLNHRSTEAKDVTYQYVVVLSVDAGEMDRSPDIEILSNNRWMQGVLHRGLGICQVIFYRGGTLNIPENIALGIDSPGAVMVKIEGEEIREISVADPSRTLGRLHLSITGDIQTGDIQTGDREGVRTTYEKETHTTRLAIDLPTGVFAGRSVTFKL